jgi:hypothetical protein
MMPHDPEERRPVLGPALLGALLGGTAGAGLPYGLKLLSDKMQLPGEESKPMGSKVVDTAVEPLLTHPATTLGTAGGLATLYAGGKPVSKAWEASGKGMPRPMGVGASLENLYKSMRGRGAPISNKNLFGQLGSRASKTWGGLRMIPGGGKMALMAPALGLGGGWLLDKYLRGEY